MKIESGSEQPLTDAACRTATGKKMSEWFKEIDALVASGSKRRDVIQALSEQTGNKQAWWCTTLFVEYERARGIVDKKDGRIEGYNICVTKSIAAPVEAIWEAWTDPKAWQHWFGDKVKAKIEVDGTFSDSAGNSGEFLRIRENKDLRFTWSHAGAPAPTQVDVTIADKGKGKSMVTLQHARLQSRDEADGLRAAWSAAFDRMKAKLEAAT